MILHKIVYIVNHFANLYRVKQKKIYIYYWVTQILSLQVLATALQIFPKVQKNLFVQCFEQIISKRIMIFEQIS